MDVFEQKLTKRTRFKRIIDGLTTSWPGGSQSGTFAGYCQERS